MSRKKIVFYSLILGAVILSGCGSSAGDPDAGTTAAEATAAETATAAPTAEASETAPAETTAAGSESPAETVTAAAEVTTAAESAADAPDADHDDLEYMMSSIEADIPKITAFTGFNFDDSDGAATAAVTSASDNIGTTASSSTDQPKEDRFQRVGKSGFGYIDVPSDWVQFKETGSSVEMFQYSDPTGQSVVTMTCYKGMAAMDAANGVAYGLDQDAYAEDVTTAKVTINGMDALQVYCYYTDTKEYYCAWFVEKGEDTYYLAIEFDDADTFDLSETYSLEK